jgi:hypothetical protein
MDLFLGRRAHLRSMPDRNLMALRGIRRVRRVRGHGIPLPLCLLSVKLTSAKAGNATGLKLSLSAKDPGAPVSENNVAVVKTVTVTLPKGSKTDVSAARQVCKEPKTTAQKCAQSAPKSAVGTGSAKAVLVGTNSQTGQPTVSNKINNAVTAYPHKGGLFLIVKSDVSTTILDASLSKKGVIKLNVARDVKPILGNNIVLTDFALNVKAIKRGKKALLRNPTICKKRFVTTVRLTYTGEKPHVITGKQNCSGRKK